VAYRLEQATGAPSEPALVKKLAIDLYLDPKRTLTWPTRGSASFGLPQVDFEWGRGQEDVEASDECARCRGATRRGRALRALGRDASAAGRVSERQLEPGPSH